MKIWYTCKVKHSKENEEGIVKQVTEAYLVDAVSYTEAETRIYKVMERDVSGEFQVTSIAKTNLEEVLNYEGENDYWFKCKISYSTLDGDSEKEIKVNTYQLVSAEDLRQAFDRATAGLNAMLVPFEISSIVKTNYVEVYPYVADELPSNLKPISGID
ncbi:MAG: DUF4494 domain-containing protein [Flammeovirgaceae bacterium]|jgi:hypothetical protein|nr:DUF4494 domain-containing protein [Flammeovirgaceae bacterium]